MPYYTLKTKAISTVLFGAEGIERHVCDGDASQEDVTEDGTTELGKNSCNKFHRERWVCKCCGRGVIINSLVG